MVSRECLGLPLKLLVAAMGPRPEAATALLYATSLPDTWE